MTLTIVIAVIAGSAVAALVLGAAFGLGFLGKPNYISNYELQVPERAAALPEPTRVIDGLAIYTAGDPDSKQTVLLFPYPHSSTAGPMITSPLVETFTRVGFRVMTFDPPGAYHSTRPAKVDMDEMLGSALETLSGAEVEGPVIAAGHSMGSLCALAFAVEHPELVTKLILVGGMSGFPAARAGYPGSRWKWYQKEYWTVILQGLRMMNGKGNLADHDRYMDFLDEPLYFDGTFFTPRPPVDGDKKIGIPIRAAWPKNMWRGVDYADRLDEVKATTLICAGLHDPETPVSCNEELDRGLPDSRLAVFTKSGHLPFVEEPDLFNNVVSEFLPR